MDYNYEYSTRRIHRGNKHKADAAGRIGSPTQAIFHLPDPFLSLCLAVVGNPLPVPGSLAKVSKVYGKAPDSFSDP
jgi:hypothetical protein